MEIKKSPKYSVEIMKNKKVGNKYIIIFLDFKALWFKHNFWIFFEKKFILKFFFGHLFLSFFFKQLQKFLFIYL